MDKELKDSILSSIELSGAASEEKSTIKPNIANTEQALAHITTRSTGILSIKKHLKFEMIFSQPLALKVLSNLEVRCCLCRTVISYPAWYYSIKYAVNQLHFFVCFDENSVNKPTVKCYRSKS